MKKLLLASAVAALSVSSAYASSDVYGRVVADMRFEEDGAITLDNGSTRVGFKGSKALSPTLNGIYQLEMAVDLDQQEGGVVKSRDSFIGMESDTLGTFKAGYITAIDDAVNFTAPSDYWNAGVLGYDTGRVENALAYESPNYSGFTFMGMYKLTDASKGQENIDIDANTGNSFTVKDDAGSMGVAATYEQGPMKAGISYVDMVDSELTALRVSGAFDLTSELTLSGLYQMADSDADGDETENTYTVAAEYDIPNSKWSAYAEYDGITNASGVKDADANVISVGGGYEFAKGLSGRVYGGTVDTDGGDDNFGMGTGLTYKF